MTIPRSPGWSSNTWMCSLVSAAMVFPLSRLGMILQDRPRIDVLGSARRHTLTEEADNLGILDLWKVLVEFADGPEVDRSKHADDVIAAAADVRKPTERGHGHGDDQLVRRLRLDSLQRGDHRRARGDPVVSKDDGPALDWRRGAHLAEKLLAPFDLPKLIAPLFGQILVRQLQGLTDAGFEVDLAVLGDGADRQFALERGAELARQHDIELGPQLARQDGADHHSASGNRQDNWVVEWVTLEPLHQQVGGLLAVAEHDDPPFRLLLPRASGCPPRCHKIMERRSSSLAVIDSFHLDSHRAGGPDRRLVTLFQPPSHFLAAGCLGRDPGPILVGQQIPEAGVESNMPDPHLGAGILQNVADLEPGDVVGQQAGIDSLAPAPQDVLPLGAGLQVPRRHVILLSLEMFLSERGMRPLTCAPCRPLALTTTLFRAREQTTYQRVIIRPEDVSGSEIRPSASCRCP